MDKLVTAILGLDDAGRLLLEAASGIDYFHIHAVADKNTKLARQTAARYGCRYYDDYRQLIIQNQLDCLLVAAPLHSCDEYLRMGMRKKFNILKQPPPARSFGEAAEFVRLAEDNGIKFAVANPLRFAESFLDLQAYLSEGNIEQVCTISATCEVGLQSFQSWQNDRKLAGGGVLLHNCYQILDQLICNFNIPQSVYCLAANQALDKKQRLYLTEDSALIVMSFNETLFGCLKAARNAAVDTDKLVIKLYGKDKILSVTDRKFAVGSKAGTADKVKEYSDTELDRIRKVLVNFALSILKPDEHKLCSSAAANLNNMAVIESAYLSARTAMPEEPSGMLQMARGRTANIRAGYK